jgi:hypothetical protein
MKKAQKLGGKWFVDGKRIEPKFIRALEVHTYAPELNKLHLICGAVFSASGITRL